MNDSVLELVRLQKSFGAKSVLESVSLSLEPGLASRVVLDPDVPTC